MRQTLRGVLTLAILLAPRAASAQDTTLVRQDTSLLVQDTSRAAAVMDTVKPIDRLARFELGPAQGFSDGVWEWRRDSLMLEAPITLGDLLERIPGILTLKSGIYLQPEAATSLGGIGNRLEVWLDGYVLDPLLESSFDLSKLELANIESVRVERRPGMIRIHIETLSSSDSRPYSMVEAGVGQPDDVNLFRGVFLAPKLFFGPIALTLDRIDTDGTAGRQPADQFAGWAKYSFIRNGSGIQAEYRRNVTDRDPEVPWQAKNWRTEMILRARARVANGVVAEVFGGRSKLEVDTSSSGHDSIPKLGIENTQWGGRVSIATKFAWARGSYRVRDATSLPSSQLEGAAGITTGIFSAAAEATQSEWRNVGTATEYSVRGTIAPLRGLRIFGEMTSSDRGVPFLTSGDTADVIVFVPDSSAIMTTHKGMRAGAEASFAGITVGGALLSLETDSVTPFGLPFDRVRQRYFGGEVKGWEATGRVPFYLIKGLYGIGTITNFFEGNVWLYLPTRMYRAGAELHTSPMKSGSLEILGRIETVFRSQMVTPRITVGPDESATVLVPEVSSLDAYLQIRILDLRAFLRYEDLTRKNVAEIPGHPLRGPRLIYGVKWQFWN